MMFNALILDPVTPQTGRVKSGLFRIENLSHHLH